MPINTKNYNLGFKSNLCITPLTYCFYAVAAASIILLFPELSEAATNASHSKVAGEAEMTAGFNIIKGLVSGIVGKIIAIVSFLFGLAASIFKFNMGAIAGSFGVSLAAALGPTAIESVVGATF
ncbi:MAG: hypothetical protein K0R73_811 [Candidatus Midichloriaceae bacterium]|jgi:hypothetical protein|nr:hypothetical protein [Candidatus Midichloriaceae bacterium]